MNLGRSKRPEDRPRSGRIGVVLAIGVAVLAMILGVGTWLVHNASRTIEAQAGPWSLKETDRLATGQQRVDRVAFAPGGDRLAGICPRYNHLLIYQVDPSDALKLAAETQLEGRPVGVVPLGGRFAVLQRPAGDAKHLEPDWWEVFDRDGHRVGSRHAAGFYPDDIAASAEGRRLFVLCSGRSEGDPKKPLGSLEILEVDPVTAMAKRLGRLSFDASDDPERLTISASGRYAAVLLAKSRRTAAVDASDPAAPRVIGRTPPVAAGAPYLSSPGGSDPDWIMMPAGLDSDTIALEAPGAARRDQSSGYLRPDYLVTTRDNESALEILRARPEREVGRFPLLGPFNLGRTRPTGLAYSPERNLIAVATRTGSIHVVALRLR